MTEVATEISEAIRRAVRAEACRRAALVMIETAEAGAWTQVAAAESAHAKRALERFAARRVGAHRVV